ncbi:MAG: ATP-binding protein [Burkholderiales bacterium]
MTTQSPLAGGSDTLATPHLGRRGGTGDSGRKRASPPGPIGGGTLNSAKMAAITVLAVVLVAGLAFLYYKTDIGEFRRQVQIASHLRELKDIDTRWESELLRLQNDSAATPLAAAHAAERLRRALQGIEDESSVSRMVSYSFPELKRAFNDKAALMEKYRITAAEARQRLDTALVTAPDINKSLRQALLSSPRQRDRITAFEQSLGAVQAEVLRFNLAPDATQIGRLEATLAALRQAELPASPTLGPLLEKFLATVDQFYKTKLQEQELYNRLQYITAGPRLDTLTSAFHRELEASVQEKELFRTALITYAGVLLILLSHIGAQLRQSYLDIAAANAALKEANEGLERRVAERTQELSQALKSLEESQSMLVQSEKMSSLGQMVAGVAHEINTPLAYVKNSLETVEGQISGMSEALTETEKLLHMLRSGADEQTFGRQFALVNSAITRLKGHGAPEDVAKLVQDGQYGITQIAEIVGNLRNFSRLDRKKVDRYNVADGLESTLSIAKHMLKSIDVKKQYNPVPAITCSPSQLNQVFLNLITNAAQATEGRADGEIRLTTRAPDPGHVEIEVADNGKGITADVLSKIFDPFFTTKEVGKGTGLGLSIAYKIVEAHGGRISVDSKAGAGTRFIVRLPVHPPDNAVAVV